MAIVFDPDPDLGTDPLDLAKQPRRLGEFYDSASCDVLLFVREFGEQFEGGSRTHIYPAGAWEHTPDKRLEKMLRKLGKL